MPICPLSKLPGMECPAGDNVLACAALPDDESPCLNVGEDIDDDNE